MGHSDGTSVADEQVTPGSSAQDEQVADKGELDESTEGEKEEGKEAAAEEGASDDTSKEGDLDKKEESKTPAALDPTDPDYWKKKYDQDEKSWKGRNSDLMSARQRAEHERDQLRKTQSERTPEPKPASPETKPSKEGEAIPSNFNSVEEWVKFNDDRAKAVARAEFQRMKEEDSVEAAKKNAQDAANARWAEAQKQDPTVEVADLAKWMQENNVFDPVHALKLRNLPSEIEAAERRGAEKMAEKIRGNKAKVTEGAAHASSGEVQPPAKRVAKNERVSAVIEMLGNADRDMQH